MRVTRGNLSACKAFVDFWDDHVIIPSIRVFYRHPTLQKKLLMVMCLMCDDFNIFKIHMMMMLMNMARKFGVMVEHQNSLFVLRNPRLQCSFGLAIVYKITLTAIDSRLVTIVSRNSVCYVIIRFQPCYIIIEFKFLIDSFYFWRRASTRLEVKQILEVV